VDRAEILKEIQRKRKELTLAYLRFLDSEDGKKIMADLGAVCFSAKSSFVAGAPDRSAFNEGCRAVYLHILRRAQIEQQPREEGDANGPGNG
jgi:hypothetical protein